MATGKWSWRSGLYKTATVFTFFVFLVYGLGFSVPTWIGRDPALLQNGTAVANKIQFQGLWLVCVGDDEIDFDDCSKQVFGDDWDWMDAVRGCWVGGMFFFLVGILYSLVENCCGDDESNDYGLTGALVLLAGLCGAAGVILTVVKMEDSNIGYDEYYWGFIVACAASGLAILLSIVLLIARNAGRPDDDSDYDEDEDKRRHGSRAIDYVHNYGKQPYHGYGYGGSPYEYQNAGYRGDHNYPGGPPLGNGVSYHHQPTPAQHPYTMYQGSSLPRHNGGGYRHSMAESADLSNGFTPTHIHAEQSSRPSRGDYYLNGSRPY
ncbi:hypothetical protein ElyMa_006776200 [Elysia marginata]|uniref:Claudin n=1 Tax=Elysia marginata TaxID=1093978 RepID=A0AAV4J309_9GAST|nr:hypothetical protein ElyMa_006776200 [Elysia marginata]